MRIEVPLEEILRFAHRSLCLKYGLKMTGITYDVAYDNRKGKIVIWDDDL